MAIDYVLELRCPVKEAVPTARLVDLVRAQRLGETPADWAQFEPLAPHCADCRANLLQQPFGCYGTIEYPIRLAVEQWLMSRLPETLDSTAGHFLVAAIRDFQYNGEPVARLRGNRDFFESRKPARRQWGPWLNKRTITSDQILQMMFGLGNLGPSHCVTLALFLGILPHDFDPYRSDTTERNRQLAAAQITPPRSDPPHVEMAAFLHTVAMSPVLDVRVLVDA